MRLQTEGEDILLLVMFACDQAATGSANVWPKINGVAHMGQCLYRQFSFANRHSDMESVGRHESLRVALIDHICLWAIVWFAYLLQDKFWMWNVSNLEQSTPNMFTVLTECDVSLSPQRKKHKFLYLFRPMTSGYAHYAATGWYLVCCDAVITCVLKSLVERKPVMCKRQVWQLLQWQKSEVHKCGEKHTDYVHSLQCLKAARYTASALTSASLVFIILWQASGLDVQYPCDVIIGCIIFHQTLCPHNQWMGGLEIVWAGITYMWYIYVSYSSGGKMHTCFGMVVSVACLSVNVINILGSVSAGNIV